MELQQGLKFVDKWGRTWEIVERTENGKYKCLSVVRTRKSEQEIFVEASPEQVSEYLSEN